MKKYKYTDEERSAIADARKNNKKGLAKIVGKIRKQCIAENRFEEVPDNRKTKEKSSKKESKSVESSLEDEAPVEVHSSGETSVIIK